MSDPSPMPSDPSPMPVGSTISAVVVRDADDDNDDDDDDGLRGLHEQSPHWNSRRVSLGILDYFPSALDSYSDFASLRFLRFWTICCIRVSLSFLCFGPKIFATGRAQRGERTRSAGRSQNPLRTSAWALATCRPSPVQTQHCTCDTYQ